MTPTKTLWKSMKAGLKSSHGDTNWKISEWQTSEGAPVRCASGGFHASENIVDAMSYVDCEILAIVEVSGEHDSESDKEAWQNMRIVQAYEWDKTASMKMAIHCAEKVIGIYEKEYPNDDRPRKAIEAAKACLANDTEENRSAAESAARSAWSAAESAAESARSARSAAESARSAARSARSARSAAESARSAARSARSAWTSARSARSARSAARSARSAAMFEKAKQEIHDWIITELVPSLKEYVPKD